MNIPIENEPAFGMAAGAGRPEKRTGAFTDEELRKAHELAFEHPCTDHERLLDAREILLLGPWRENGDAGERRFALALGVLPEGWERHHASDSIFVLYSKAHDQWVITAAAEGGHVAIHSPPWYWPEAVRSGQAEIACRLMAAHVELERLRAQKGGGE